MTTSTTFAQCVSDRTGDSTTVAAARLEELRRFFLLIHESGQVQSPSAWVDEAWHALLDSPVEGLYAEYLRSIGVGNIWHQPGDHSLDHQHLYLKTRQDLLARYGKLDDIAWPADAAAANCTGGDAGDGGNSPDFV